MDNVKLDFEQAKAKHLLFKSRLRSILFGGEVDEAPVLSHHECAVGKWIYGHALKEYGHIPEMQELERVHEDIHTSARDLITLYKGGKQDDARRGLSEMEKIADHLVGLLTTLEEKIEQDDEASKNVHEYQPFEVSLKEFNDLLKANEQLDRQIKQYVLSQKESEDRYRVLFDSIDQGFCIIEVIFDENDNVNDWRFLEVNPAFSKQNGLTDAVGKRMLELVPNIEQRWFEIYGDVAKTGNAKRFVEGSEAMERWFDVYAFRFGEKGSNKVAVLFTDITASKKAEEALKIQTKATLHERQILHDFFMQAPASFCILRGADHVFELANADYMRLVGGRDVIGKTVREALPEVEGQGFFELLDRVFTTGEPFIGNEVELSIDKGKGLEQAYVNFIYQGFKNVEGEPEGILVFAYDITEQVQARKQLQQAYDDLEIKVTFRNIELERLNKEKSEKIAELEKELDGLRSDKA
ncbi:MAG: PAS domain-containing protein [Bacteroidota bacterium]